jgi:hypothetical protein
MEAAGTAGQAALAAAARAHEARLLEGIRAASAVGQHSQGNAQIMALTSGHGAAAATSRSPSLRQLREEAPAGQRPVSQGPGSRGPSRSASLSFATREALRVPSAAAAGGSAGPVAQGTPLSSSAGRHSSSRAPSSGEGGAAPAPPGPRAEPSQLFGALRPMFGNVARRPPSGGGSREHSMSRLAVLGREASASVAQASSARQSLVQRRASCLALSPATAGAGVIQWQGNRLFAHDAVQPTLGAGGAPLLALSRGPGRPPSVPFRTSARTSAGSRGDQLTSGSEVAIEGLLGSQADQEGARGPSLAPPAATHVRRARARKHSAVFEGPLIGALAQGLFEGNGDEVQAMRGTEAPSCAGEDAA